MIGIIRKEHISTVSAKAREEARRIRLEMKKSIVTAVTAAFGFVIALFWRDLIKDWIDSVLASLNLTGEKLTYELIAAIFVTVIAVVGILLVSRWAGKTEE